MDFSGSRAELDGVRIEGVNDRAISAGEGRDVVLRNLSVHEVGVAIASKDRSQASVRGAEIVRVRVAGLMSYVKKPAYGPASIDALGVAFGREVSLAPVAQTGSWVMLNGVPVDPRNLDVERF